MEKKWRMIVNLYGIWALLFGGFEMYLPFWAYIKGKITLSFMLISGPFAIGIFYILLGIFVLIRMNERIPLTFIISNLLFMCITNYAGIKAAPSKALIAQWGIFWIIMTIIMPLTSVYFFTRPKVKEQFK